MARKYKRDSRGRFAGGGGGSSGRSRPKVDTRSPQQKGADTRRRNAAAKIARTRKITRNINTVVRAGVILAPVAIAATSNIRGAVGFARASRAFAKQGKTIKVKATRI
jgi:hypothetical protein